MKPVNRKEILEGIAKDLNLPLELVEKAVSTQFKFVKKVISSGSPEKGFEAVRLRYFGVFKVVKGRYEKLTENNKKSKFRRNGRDKSKRTQSYD